MQVKVWRNPYETGVNITTPRNIELQPGLTVLVGCNGAGKSTLIKNIEDEALHNKIPCCKFDNMTEGGSSSISTIVGGYSEYEGDSLETGMALWTASEGEAIKINVSRHSTLYREFLKTGYFKNSKYRLKRIFSEDEDEKNIEDKRRIFLFDAADSGMSIDAVLEFKAMFVMILKEAAEEGLECYIVIAANEYEMCRGESCFDVNTGKYLDFKDYEDYRAFIIKSRERKTKRLEKERAHYLKQQEKNYEKYKQMNAKAQKDIEKIQEKAHKENRELNWREKHRIDDIKYSLKSFIRDHNLAIPGSNEPAQG